MLTKMIEQIINKRQETRKVFMKNVMGDMDNVEHMSDEEFKFMKSVLELERMTDDLLGTVGTEIEKLQIEVDKLNKEILGKAK